MDLNKEQQEAFEAACTVVSLERAEAILKLKNWQHGGCLTVRTRPEIPDVSDEEDQAFRKLWLTLPGWSSWMTSLYLVRNHHPDKENDE